MFLFNRKASEQRRNPPILGDAKFLEFGKEQAFTPDVAVLERRSDWFLFVPDEMMSKHRDNDKLGGSAVKMAEAVTEDKFSFWKKDLGELTQAIPLEERFPRTPFTSIRGEIFLVKSQQFFKLDTMRQNGVEFERRRIKLKIPYRKARKVFVKDRSLYEWAIDNTHYHEGNINAWMYVGKSEYWSNLIDGGYMYSPVKSFIPNNPALEQYYYFTPGEYDRTISEPRTVLRMRKL